jgi:hypothetical protein
MAIGKYVALMIAGVLVAAIFLVAALIVFAAAVWILAAAADFLASLGSERQVSPSPSASHFP